MNITLNVEATAEREFNPTLLKIMIGEKTATHVEVTTKLTEITAKGDITETSVNLFPIAVLSIFNGFDTETLKPNVNVSAMNTLLANYNLIIA